MKTVSIFWTGGYDSTFRIVQLSRKAIYIQPYYMLDNRDSEQYELDAIRKITNRLLQDKATKAVFKPLIIVKIEDRPMYPEICQAYKYLRQSDYMGSQYEWLACFTMDHPGVEMSIHKDDKAIKLITSRGKLKSVFDETIGSFYIIDPDHSSKEMVSVFGNSHYPLVDYSKLDMKEEYAKYHLEDVANMTWFCHSPINGKPCGLCGPCKYTIEEGMLERFDKKALTRYKRGQNKLLYLSYRIIRKLNKILHM